MSWLELHNNTKEHQSVLIPNEPLVLGIYTVALSIQIQCGTLCMGSGSTRKLAVRRRLLQAGDIALRGTVGLLQLDALRGTFSCIFIRPPGEEVTKHLNTSYTLLECMSLSISFSVLFCKARGIWAKHHNSKTIMHNVAEHFPAFTSSL